MPRMVFAFCGPKRADVVKALAAIMAADTRPFRLIFGGGTALGRAYGLIHRMLQKRLRRLRSKRHPTSVQGVASGRPARHRFAAVRDDQGADIGFVPWSDRSPSPASENLARSCESPVLDDPSFPSSLGYDKPKNKDFHRFKALAAKQPVAR
jgi:hypothetical protein